MSGTFRRRAVLWEESSQVKTDQNRNSEVVFHSTRDSSLVMFICCLVRGVWVLEFGTVALGSFRLPKNTKELKCKGGNY